MLMVSLFLPTAVCSLDDAHFASATRCHWSVLSLRPAQHLAVSQRLLPAAFVHQSCTQGTMHHVLFYCGWTWMCLSPANACVTLSLVCGGIHSSCSHWVIFFFSLLNSALAGGTNHSVHTAASPTSPKCILANTRPMCPLSATPGSEHWLQLTVQYNECGRALEKVSWYLVSTPGDHGSGRTFHHFLLTWVWIYFRKT